MSETGITRREFMVNAAAATAALAMGKPVVKIGKIKSPYDAKGLPTAELGKTGIKVPRIGYGTGSRFCAVAEEEKALGMLEYALDHGLYYWDTSHAYGDEQTGVVSEERLGKIVRHRRDEIFLATKLIARDGDEARKQLELSLKRLGTDYIDLLHCHSIESPEDAKEVARKGGLLDVVRSAKDEGVARFIGFTGHASDEAMAWAAKHFDVDAMQIALNHYYEREEEKQDFENKSVPVAAKKGLGVIGMKVIRPRETVKALKPEQLIRYALSLKKLDMCVISMDRLELVKANIGLLKSFKPLGKEEMDELRVMIRPFYRGQDVAWMQPGYRDGIYM